MKLLSLSIYFFRGMFHFAHRRNLWITKYRDWCKTSAYNEEWTVSELPHYQEDYILVLCWQSKQSTNYTIWMDPCISSHFGRHFLKKNKIKQWQCAVWKLNNPWCRLFSTKMKFKFKENSSLFMVLLIYFYL